MGKKIFKNRIFIFVLGVFIASSISVLAATYFESSAVTYDNTKSGLSSTNVQGAIDELYNECFPPTPPTPGDQILDNVDIVTSGDGLYEDEYEEGRFIFKGGNPNNYITFNNEKAGWRIISVEPDKTIKIMKIASIENEFWDNTYNDWTRPATVNAYLNVTYYNGLNETTKNQIVASNFSIGAVTHKNKSMSMQVSEENSNKWYGNVALPTASEYIRTNSNKSSCGTFSLIYDNYSSCVSTGWMDNSDYWWTLSPYSGYYGNAFAVYSDGSVNYHSVSGNPFGVRPVVFLSSKVQITGGDGTQNNPYTLG